MQSLEEQKCHQCQKPTTNAFVCPLCSTLSCKNCVSFTPASAFSFMKRIPTELSHPRYCSNCFATAISPALENYRETMARAKKVYIVERPPRKPLPILKRSTESLSVRDCTDRKETIMRLAFQSAALGFNAVVKVKVAYEKVRNAGYQKMMWHGTGSPVELDARRVEHNAKVSAEL